MKSKFLVVKPAAVDIDKTRRCLKCGEYCRAGFKFCDRCFNK